MPNTFQQALAELEKEHQLFSEHPFYLDAFVAVRIKEGAFTPVLLNHEDLLQAATEAGLSTAHMGNNVDDFKALFVKIAKLDDTWIAGSLFFLPFEAQFFLRFCACAEHFTAYRAPLDLAALYRAAKAEVRTSLFPYIVRLPEAIEWRLGESIDEAMLRVMAYFNTFHYAYKGWDIRYTLLVWEWAEIMSGKLVDTQRLYAFYFDPAIAEFRQAYPDFTLEKLVITAYQNLRAHEEKHDKVDFEVFDTAVARSLVGLDRQF